MYKRPTLTELLQGEDVSRLITITQVAQMTGISKQTLLKAIQNGMFPKAVKFGRWRRWRMSDIHQWLNEISKKRG